MTATDRGLPDALERVRDAFEMHSRCDCLGPDVDPVEWERHVEQAVACAAREDVPDAIQQARADALYEAANDISGRLESFPKLGAHTRATWAVTILRDLAAAIREGKTP